MMRWTRVLPAIGVLALATAVLAGEPWVMETWQRQGASVDFKKVVVVGISTDGPTRRRFEDKFVTNLRGQRMECITGWSIVEDLGDAPETDVVVKALLEEGVDTVITVRLTPPGEDPTAWKDQLENDVGVRDYITSALGESPDLTKPVEAWVSLWNRGTGQQVWAARTGPHKISKLRKNASEIVREVINDLKHDQIF